MTAPSASPLPDFAYQQPDDALNALCDAIGPVDVEAMDSATCFGRVLAEPIGLDRPSPACDVSAMDGYAIRLNDVHAGLLAVDCEVSAGESAPALPIGAAIRIFTGAMIPPGTEAIIPREQLEEFGHGIRFPHDLVIRPGQHIRRSGENGLTGDVIVKPGRVITPPIYAAIASCGVKQVRVYRRLRVGILVTGGEVRTQDQPLQPWQLRDCNGPALQALLGNCPWLMPLPTRHAIDDPRMIRENVASVIQSCDALLLTGGVSAGDHDYVPRVLQELGADIVFHKLPIRPGKPVLGAVSSQGRPILGLPGNPVSVMVTARRLAMPALRRRAGLLNETNDYALIDVVGTASAPKSLTWFPLVSISPEGRAVAVDSKGSGDWVSAGRSDGFVQIPPGEHIEGRRPLYRWFVTE